ncbi:hypothetical protein [Pseudoalteromonas sp. 2CM32C]|uniref:hypothetical protein n=1 Tax=Pseudoalteromonas sp. 2CM32C TaxID=2929852 RepID=UPI0020BF3628|nr:hypothetical protein [Pseudoalteromonas sp. 2CM32C]MCK8121110.1 hypothetical protein [Pseudoalteromonas sp. 2CM32C]
MKFLIIFVLIATGILIYLSTGAKKADSNVYAKFHSSDSVEIAGKILTLAELISYISELASEGKVIDISISGGISEQLEIEAMAKTVKESKEFRGRNVLMIIES